MRFLIAAAVFCFTSLSAASAALAQGADCDTLTLRQAEQRMQEFTQAGSAGAYVLPNGYILRIGADSTLCSRQPEDTAWSISKFDQQGVVVITRRDFPDRTEKRVFTDKIDYMNKHILGRYLLVVEVGNTLYTVSTTEDMGS